MKTLALVLTLVCSVPGAAAQWRAPLHASYSATPAADDGARARASGSVLLPAGGAILGGAAGFIVGGLIGASITSEGCPPGDPDACLGAAFPGFLWGAGAGMTIGSPVGAHLANGRRGKLGRSLLVSSALFAAEVGLLQLLVDDGRTEHRQATFALVVAVPLLQAAAATHIEHTTGR